MYILIDRSPGREKGNFSLKLSGMLFRASRFKDSVGTKAAFMNFNRPSMKSPMGLTHLSPLYSGVGSGGVGVGVGSGASLPG